MCYSGLRAGRLAASAGARNELRPQSSRPVRGARHRAHAFDLGRDHPGQHQGSRRNSSARPGPSSPMTSVVSVPATTSCWRSAPTPRPMCSSRPTRRSWPDARPASSPTRARTSPTTATWRTGPDRQARGRRRSECARRALTLIAYVLAFNPEIVKQPVTSWADLWRPEFAGKLAFASPVHSMMPAFVIVAAEMSGGSAPTPIPGSRNWQRSSPPSSRCSGPTGLRSTRAAT